MSKEEIVELIKKEMEMERKSAQVARHFKKSTWLPWQKITWHISELKYIHAYATLAGILIKIGES